MWKLVVRTSSPRTRELAAKKAASSSSLKATEPWSAPPPWKWSGFTGIEISARPVADGDLGVVEPVDRAQPGTRAPARGRVPRPSDPTSTAGRPRPGGRGGKSTPPDPGGLSSGPRGGRETTHMRPYDSILVLGGAGLVGYQVCRRALREGLTKKVIVVSLWQGEVNEAVGLLQGEFPEAEIVGRYGNVFARGVLVDASADANAPGFDRRDPAHRRDLLADIYESFDGARESSALVQVIEEFRPAAVVDCINTATAISYQDVPTTAKQLMADMGLRGSGADVSPEALHGDIQNLLVSVEIPQLILHVRLLVEAMTAVGSDIYVKVGTTGTGGMGLNIPYTHGEDKPSPTLMAKTAVAFAHTGLLFLADRTEGGPAFKELKPAAMIGYKAVAVQDIPGYVWEKRGRAVPEVARPGPAALRGPDRHAGRADRHDTGQRALPASPRRRRGAAHAAHGVREHRRERVVQPRRVRGDHGARPDGDHHA